MLYALSNIYVLQLKNTWLTTLLTLFFFSLSLSFFYSSSFFDFSTLWHFLIFLSCSYTLILMLVSPTTWRPFFFFFSSFSLNYLIIDELWRREGILFYFNKVFILAVKVFDIELTSFRKSIVLLYLSHPFKLFLRTIIMNWY